MIAYRIPISRFDSITRPKSDPGCFSNSLPHHGKYVWHINCCTFDIRMISSILSFMWLFTTRRFSIDAWVYFPAYACSSLNTGLPFGPLFRVPCRPCIANHRAGQRRFLELNMQLSVKLEILRKLQSHGRTNDSTVIWRGRDSH